MKIAGQHSEQIYIAAHLN